MNTITTKKPIRPKHVEDAGKVLWDRTREDEGKVPWEEAADFAREPYLQQARLVLETVFPLDEGILIEWLSYIEEAIELI